MEIIKDWIEIIFLLNIGQYILIMSKRNVQDHEKEEIFKNGKFGNQIFLS